MSKGLGTKIAIKFDKALTGDVSAVVETLENENLFASWMASYDSAGTVLYTPDNCMDVSTSTYWRVNTTGSWWEITLTKPAIVSGFRYYSGSLYRLRAYVFEGSNDRTNWTELWSGENPNETGWQEISFENETAYLYYRWSFTSAWSSRTYLYEFELFGDIDVGNERAFTVSGQEPLYTEIPSEVLGPLVDGDYEVLSVEAHPTEANTILLTMTGMGKFRKLEGNLTVAYDMTKGNLAGLGGAVLSFEEVFTPEDLERMINPNVSEIVNVSVVDLDITAPSVMHNIVGDGPWSNAGTVDEATYQDQHEHYPNDDSETVTIGITDLVVAFTHLDDLDP